MQRQLAALYFDIDAAVDSAPNSDGEGADGGNSDDEEEEGSGPDDVSELVDDSEQHFDPAVYSTFAREGSRSAGSAESSEDEEGATEEERMVADVGLEGGVLAELSEWRGECDNHGFGASNPKACGRLYAVKGWRYTVPSRGARGTAATAPPMSVAVYCACRLRGPRGSSRVPTRVFEVEPASSTLLPGDRRASHAERDIPAFVDSRRQAMAALLSGGVVADALSFVRLLEGQCCEHQRAAMCVDPDMEGEWWRCEICETAGVCHQGRWTHPADPSSFLAFVYDRCCRLPPAMLQSLQRGALLSSWSATSARARGGAAAASGGGGAPLRWVPPPTGAPTARTDFGRLPPSAGAAFTADTVPDDIPAHDCGSMAEICCHCGALFWRAERTSTQSYRLCCSEGRVVLRPSRIPGAEFTDMFHDPKFLKDVRTYNNKHALASTTFGDDTYKIPKKGGGVQKCGYAQLRVQGQLTTLTSATVNPDKPARGPAPAFAEVYMLENDAQVAARSCDATLDRRWSAEIGLYLTAHNPYVKACFMMMEKVKALQITREIADVHLVIHDEHHRPQSHPSLDTHARLWTKPADDGMVTAFTVVQGDGEAQGYGARSLAVTFRATPSKLQSIHPCSPSNHPMRFPLLFPFGCDGYHPALKQACGKRRVTHVQHARYTLHERAAGTERTDVAPKAAATHRRYSLIHRAGRLFGEYILTLYLAAEQSRLLFHRFNQTKLRADVYENVFTHLHSGCDQIPGKLVVLAPSFTTGPRHYAACFHNAMAIVREHHKADLFITFTCNPKVCAERLALLVWVCGCVCARAARHRV